MMSRQRVTAPTRINKDAATLRFHSLGPFFNLLNHMRRILQSRPSVQLFVFPDKFSTSIYAYIYIHIYMGGWRCRFYASVFRSTDSNNIMNTIIRKVLSPYSQNAGEIQMT